MLLNVQERLRFMEYCKAESESCGSLFRQLEKINGMPEMLRRLKQRAAAYGFVALDLASAKEEVIVSNKESGDAQTDAE